ncbi:MAG: hypothetical protein ACK587_15155 [Cyanobacteriota bacterium]
MPPGAVRRGALPPGALPPGAMPPGALPPGALPPGALPPGALPPGSLPPGGMPPGAMPPGRGGAMVNSQRLGQAAATDRQSRSPAWAPWASVGLGLLFAAGVAGVVVNRRQRRKEQSEADGPSPGA